MKWLITGGCGFIGSALIRTLASQPGCQVRVLDNLSVGTIKDLDDVLHQPLVVNDGEGFSDWGDRVQVQVGEISRYEDVHSACLGADVVVHLAANTGVYPSVLDPRSDCVTNVLGTLNVLEASRAADAGRVIFASSGAPAGEIVPPIHEEIVPKPVSPYGASKLAGEGYCSAYFRTFGLETVALRFGNVYGPGSVHKGSVVAKFIKQILNQDDIEIYGDGSQTRDYIYINDLVDAIIRASKSPKAPGEIFQIATSQETSISELVDIIADQVVSHGLNMPSIYRTERRQGDVARNFSDVSKARKLLEWEAKTELRDGIGRTLNYFRTEAHNECF